MRKLFGILICITFFGLVSIPADVAANPDSAVTLKYYGHSVFTLEKDEVTLVFDPYLTGNPWNVATAEEIDADYILLSHGHQDHLGDTVSIAKRTDATVITTAAMARILKEQGVKTHPMGIGGKKAFEFGSVKVTPAIHDSGIPGGVAAGFIVNFYGTTLYFAGDTALFGDMALLGRLDNIDYALLPIGDNYTMGAADAVEAGLLLKPRVVIPMHYNSNPLIQQSPEEFKALAEKQGIPVKVMQPGETLVLSPVLFKPGTAKKV